MRHLDKTLDCGPLQEIAVRFVDPPLDLSKQFARVRAVKVVLLAVKGIKEFVVACGDIPPPFKVRDVETVIQDFIFRYGVGVFGHSLGHTLLVAHRAAIERCDGFILIEVTTPECHDQNPEKTGIVIMHLYHIHCHRVGVLRHSLRHTLLVADSTTVESRDGFVLVQVTRPARKEWRGTML